VNEADEARAAAATSREQRRHRVSTAFERILLAGL
jgi:hypothetical protein